jgi:hypothetical protein
VRVRRWLILSDAFDQFRQATTAWLGHRQNAQLLQSGTARLNR